MATSYASRSSLAARADSARAERRSLDDSLYDLERRVRPLREANYAFEDARRRYFNDMDLIANYAMHLGNLQDVRVAQWCSRELGEVIYGYRRSAADYAVQSLAHALEDALEEATRELRDTEERISLLGARINGYESELASLAGMY